MKTPTLLKDKLTGKLKNRLLVHRGFYGEWSDHGHNIINLRVQNVLTFEPFNMHNIVEYLFDNDKKLNDEERYETILKDIQKVLKVEEGYEIFVTGHRWVIVFFC